jgi:hypothetical protein
LCVLAFALCRFFLGFFFQGWGHDGSGVGRKSGCGVRVMHRAVAVGANGEGSAATLAGAKCECGGVRKYFGLIPHDFRRSAAKAARRAGVPESVIMAMGGWKTPSMFRRYAIVSSADQRAAVEMITRERAERNLSPPFGPPKPEHDRLDKRQESSRVQ